jgi:hypothetical protein
VRKIEVKATPEECVRQKVLLLLMQNLGYPSSLIVVEKKLSELPLSQSDIKKIPNRRIDILCFASGKLFQPLLLIECKAKSFGDRELRQLLGYNYYVGAHAVALVNNKKTAFLEVSSQLVQDYIPTYQQLSLAL